MIFNLEMKERRQDKEIDWIDSQWEPAGKMSHAVTLWVEILECAEVFGAQQSGQVGSRGDRKVS